MRLYGTEWKDDASPLAIELKCIKKGGTWVDHEGYVCGLGLEGHFKNAMHLMWPEDDDHRWSDMIIKSLTTADVSVILGSSDCVSGDTRIFDPLTGENPTIESLCSKGKEPTVMTLYGPERASIPYYKGVDWLYEVVCSNGRKFTATSRHLVLTMKGFSYVEDLRIGQHLPSYVEAHSSSISDISREVPRRDVCCSTHRSRDFQDDCRHESCSCDERLQTETVDAQGLSPLLGDVPKHNQCGFYQDGLGNRCECNHLSFSNARQSIEDSLIQASPLRIHGLRRSFEEIPSLGIQLFQLLLQFQQDRRLPYSSSKRDRDTTRNGTGFLCSLLNTVSQTRVVTIRKIGHREFFDITVPNAGHYFAEGFIHHNSGKTYSVAKFIITDWWADPMKRLWLVSSTEKRGAELRIWGKLKEFFNRARKLFPWLPGKVLESKSCITPSEITDDGSEGRLLTQGIIFIPTKSGATWLGMGPWVGVKPPPGGKLGHAGDEAQLMQHGFLDAYANWYGKENFQGVLTGNPGDLEDPLCTAAEPVDGWDNWKDTGKTQEWESKFYGAHVICLDGRDTPNNDFPYVGGKPKFPYLIGKKKLDSVKALYGDNDWHWWHQCVGKPQTSVQARRVITRAIVEHNHAYDEPIWQDGNRTKVCSLDAAYGGVGGDRCVIMPGEFGKEVGGKTVLAPGKWELVPVSVANNPKQPEIQIAEFCKDFCESKGIPPENFFFDGRGTLAVAMARIWSPEVNVVDFGGPATDRPVSNDEFIWDGDNEKRLKLCSEHYFNFVTELWFSLHYLIISGQMKNLDREVARESFKRTWDMTRNNKIQVEPKRDMKERTLQSPDLADTMVTLLEGARRLGLEIGSTRSISLVVADDYLAKELAKYDKIRKASSLKYDTAH